MSTSPTTVAKSASEQSAAEQIASLMDQMRSKDALVLQLTEGLEAAAEQLDRIQRTGSDRRHPGAGGGSRELVEQTGQLTSKVEEALESWGQSSSHYETILQRLDEISDHLSRPGSHVEGRSTPRSSSPAPASSHAAPSAPATGGPGGTFWEKMKASMVDGVPAPATTSASTSAASHSSASSVSSTDPINSQPSLPEIHLSVPPPVMIDTDTASIEELREAVIAREAYISALIVELRAADTLPELPADLLNSGLGPDELLASLVELEARMKTGVQRECLDLSLERARMGRERVRLDQVKAQLESHIKRLTTLPSPDKSEQGPANEEPSIAQGKLSWLKRLAPKAK